MEILQAVRCYMNGCINTIYQFIKSFLDNKCLFLRNMGPLTVSIYFIMVLWPSQPIRVMSSMVS